MQFIRVAIFHCTHLFSKHIYWNDFNYFVKNLSIQLLELLEEI